MGACNSLPEPLPTEPSTKIRTSPPFRRKKKLKTTRLLLLGTGESGKSTLFKQITQLYGEGFSVDDRESQAILIHENVVESIQVLTTEVKALGNELGVELPVDVELRKIGDKILSLPVKTVLTPELAEEIAHLWEDDGYHQVYKYRSKFQLPDCAKYFLDKVEAIAKTGWIPTIEDVLKSRVRTTGILKMKFTFRMLGKFFAYSIENRHTYELIDVGGQRNERKKWKHVYDIKVSAILYVTAVSEYDQKLFEDVRINRVEESLRLFAKVCWNESFKKTAIILILNKSDLFEEKFGKSPLSEVFPDFSGKSLEEAYSFIEEKFKARNPVSGKVIYTHITCATSIEDVDRVFNRVHEQLTEEALKKQKSV